MKKKIEIIGDPVYPNRVECLKHAQRLESMMIDGIAYYRVPERIGLLGLFVSYCGQAFNAIAQEHKAWSYGKTDQRSVGRYLTMSNRGGKPICISISIARALALVFVKNAHPAIYVRAEIKPGLDIMEIPCPTDISWGLGGRKGDTERVAVMIRNKQLTYYRTIGLLVRLECPWEEDPDHVGRELRRKLARVGWCDALGGTVEYHHRDMVDGQRLS